MKIFETPYDGKIFGYVVGKNNVQSITRVRNKVTISAENDELGPFTTVFDLTKLPMYTIG